MTARPNGLDQWADGCTPEVLTADLQFQLPERFGPELVTGLRFPPQNLTFVPIQIFVADMRNANLLLPLACVGLLALVQISSAQVDPPSILKVLFLGDAGHHQPKERFAQMQPEMQARGIQLEYTEALGDLNAANLRNYVAVAVYANIDEIDAAAERALVDYVRAGGGFVPIHCASYCFRNSPTVVSMIGAQFKQHGTGVFRTEIAAPDHPVMRGFGGFESWDETYVHHLHHETGRTVLEYRVDNQGREPWTWVRNEGRGRVFYTAWGHDDRTWGHPGFVNLVERGIRWAAGDDPARAGDFQTDLPFPVPHMTSLPAQRPAFSYVDVGKQIPNYIPSARWGEQGEPLNRMQQPLPPEDSMRHLVTPVGFRVELFAAEPDLQGKPIAMAWDERGRLWVCETVDYPNEQQPPGEGRDHIRICEDTDRDGRADQFTQFATGLSIPTSLAFYRGGVIVQNGTETLYLRDTNGDDVADTREVWYTGWDQSDTHGGVSNFQYGLDNWFWAMQGYNPSRPQAGERKFQRFSQGFFRFNPRTRDIEFIRATDNNTWGLGISEEGLIFGSTANRNPSVFMPIPNRYYERVAGWRASLTLGAIADTHLFQPITDRVRQVDHHGGYTAGAGHSLYTARTYPRAYWNRTAFVNGPTGHLVGTFVLKPDGAGFCSSNPFNLLASEDEWTAPIMAEVGPDGNVWVIDWYNYIVQHNPTPLGFETGKGAAYETGLRDKTRGRIYRVVYEGGTPEPSPNLAGALPGELVAALAHPTLLWRRHAQRLLVEREQTDVVPELLQLLSRRQLDGIGLDVGAIHALWTLQGLGVIADSHPDVVSAVRAALAHPSAGVRRNALQVLPPDDASTAAVLEHGLLRDRDPQVRLQALLTLADMPAHSEAGKAIVASLRLPKNQSDRWILDAATSAAAQHASSFLTAAVQGDAWATNVVERVTVVAEHTARRQADVPFQFTELTKTMVAGTPEVAAAIVRGWVAGWPSSNSAAPPAPGIEEDLRALFQHLPLTERASVLQLADRWNTRCLEEHAASISADLVREIDDMGRSQAQRVDAACRLVHFRPADTGTIETILERLTPQTEPGLAAGLVTALAELQSDALGPKVVAAAEGWTPALRQQAFDVLLRRGSWTTSLLDSLDQARLQVSDLTLEQRRALASHPSDSIRKRAVALFERGGALVSPDRQSVLEQYRAAIERSGQVARGKQVFTQTCAKCHRHSGEGTEIGPDLTGMAVHPKEELLGHILDPNRSVEANFRMYIVQTIDGLTLSGMLAGESQTAIELIDTQAQRKSILREDIEEMRVSQQSVMPEGFEKEVSLEQMTDLLEFLASRGAYLPLDLSKVASAASDLGMFIDRGAEVERLVFDAWGDQTFQGVPFTLLDPRGGQRPNVILFHSPRTPLVTAMPKSVELPVNSSARAIHFLSGVSGWGFPYDQEPNVSLIVKLCYADGPIEEHPLKNAEHFADYIRRVDVPGSEFAFDLRGRQIRYLAIIPARTEAIQKIQLVKGPDGSAPVVMAVTVETR